MISEEESTNTIESIVEISKESENVLDVENSSKTEPANKSSVVNEDNESFSEQWKELNAKEDINQENKKTQSSNTEDESEEKNLEQDKSFKI